MCINRFLSRVHCVFNSARLDFLQFVLRVNHCAVTVTDFKSSSPSERIPRYSCSPFCSSTIFFSVNKAASPSAPCTAACILLGSRGRAQLVGLRKLTDFLSVLKQGLDVVMKCSISPTQGAQCPEDFCRLEKQVYSRWPNYCQCTSPHSHLMSSSPLDMFVLWPVLDFIFQIDPSVWKHNISDLVTKARQANNE